MPRQTPHSQTIFHLVPVKKSVWARDSLLHQDNELFVSYCKNANEGKGEYGLEIGYHVSARPRPQVIVEVGRDADLILRGPTISKVHFSFEVHPESRQIVFHDRSRLRNTKLDPDSFRTDGYFRHVVLQPGIAYTISVGGERADQYVFDLVWSRVSANVLEEIEKGYQMAEARTQNPRWARTVEEGPTELPSWYHTRLHTPIIGPVKRTTQYEQPLGKGSFGEVYKGVDLDSGRLIAIKKIILTPGTGRFPSNEEGMLRREVRILSSISHKNIVEYLGSSGWDTGTVHVYMSLKNGNICDLLEQFRTKPSGQKVLMRLLHEMLEALDYLAFRGWVHRDVKPENILYTPLSDEDYVFQLADFGLAQQQQLAKTFCGTLLYMAPELMDSTLPQSPKMDVWSLFVVIGVMTQAGGLDDPKLAHYREVLPRVRAAAEKHQVLSPMAREHPDMRASAAQMLAKYFDGQGLSTPRRQIGPIPDHTSAVGQPEALAQHKLDPKSNAPKPNVKKAAAIEPRRTNNAPPRLLTNRMTPRRDVHPKGTPEIGRGEGLRRSRQFT